MLDGHFRKTITAGNFFVGFSRQQSIQHILFALGQPIAWDKIIGAFLQAEICWDKNLALSHQGHGAIERLDANVLGNITHSTGSGAVWSGMVTMSPAPPAPPPPPQPVTVRARQALPKRALKNETKTHSAITLASTQ